MLKQILTLGIMLTFLSFAYAQEETITITTYYPSPYGEYNELRTHSNTYLATDSGSVGIGTMNLESGRKLEVVGGGTDRHTASFIGSDGTGIALGYVSNFPNKGSIQAFNKNENPPARYKDLLFNVGGGNVGIGTDNPGDYKLYVNGNQYLNGNLTLNGNILGPADIAEDIECLDCESGDVVVIDHEHDRQVKKSTQAYDSAVAGVISEKPSLYIGKNESKNVKPLALVGQVKCKVTSENGSIKRGSLLVTSSKPGYAMRADLDKIKPGMLIGKALESLEEAEGKVSILITGI